MAQYQTISETDIARGIDARSTENRIEAGFAEDLTNVDTNSNGFLSKRPGYQGYYGYLPIRITQIEHSGTDIIFTLDGSVDTTNIGDRPIVVAGKLSGSQSGDWSNTFNAEYYATIDTDAARRAITTGGSPLEVNETDHGNDTPWLFTQLLESTSVSDNDNEWFLNDATQIDVSATTYDVDFDYTIGANTSVFALISDKSTVAGTTYNATTTLATGTHTNAFQVSAATHALNNFNILAQVYYDNGANERELVIPDEVRINAASGQVEVDITNSGSSADFYLVLSSTDTTNTASATITAGATDSLVISTTEAFNYTSVYRTSGGTLTQIIPDSIVYDDSADTLTITITNSTGSDQVFTAYYDSIAITSTTVTVTDNGGTSATYTDTSPQLTLWGISHDGLYKTSSSQEGHVTHIDSYRSLAEERMVAGLGGNLFSAQTRAEAGSDYLIPSTTVSIENRSGADVELAPLFDTTGSSVTRTRGLITDDTIASNLATVTAVSYVSSTTADYTISFDSAQTLTGKIDSNDKFVVSGMGHGVWNGTFAFEGTITNDGTTDVTVRLTNTNAILDTYDETGANGKIGCFTDKITLSATTNFQASDEVQSSSFGNLTPSVVYTNSTTLQVDGITSQLSVPSGLLLFGQRTGTVFPVVDETNFVTGDICSITGYNQLVRVTSIDTANNTLTFDESLTLADGSVPATVSVVGRWIPIEAPTTSDDLPDTTYIRHFDSNNYSSQSTLRSVMVADNMYLTNQADEVLKFDGTSLYQAGIFRWQPQMFAQLDTTTTSITAEPTVAIASSSGNKLTVTNYGDQVQFAAGDSIYKADDDKVFIVKSVGDDGTATPTAYIYLTEDVTNTGATTIRRTARYRYYFRLNAIDSNDNVIASAATGSSDFFVDLSAAGQIHMRLIGFPTWGIYDYDKLEVEVYRTARDTAAPFYRVRTADINFNHGEGYIDIVDSTDDEFLQDFDPVSVALLGAELGTAWEQPLRSKYVTTADNRLILANVKDYPELDIVLRKTPGATSITAANLDTAKFLFRKDSTDTGTTTNMVGRATYEFVDGGAVTITPTSDISTSVAGTTFDFIDGDVTTGTDNIAETGHGLQTGVRVQLTTTGTLPTGLATGTTYYVIRVDANNLKLAADLDDAIAGTAVDITAAAGGGTHTITVSNSEVVILDNTNSVAAGSWVYFYHNATGTDNELNMAGWFQVAAAESTGFIIDFSGHGRAGGAGASADVDRYVTATTTTDIPVWLGTDGNYNQVGGNTIDEFTAMLRLANAINASMRMADTTLSSPDQTTFVPWMTANAGSEYGVGRLVVRQPKVFSTTLEVKTPAAITNANIFIGGILRSASTEYSATTRVFPSRVLISYPNYPEIFDAPFANQSESTSVVDVNSADGQEITGIIPFFGESVFGGGQAEGVLVVFKENSIYLLDINTRGLTKIQSRGLGCTAPYSIASTRDGIMFANEAGVYRLNRDQRVTYVGKYVERIWEDTVNKNQLSIMTGHHYGRGRQYKLSVPSGSATVNSLVLVYDHQREGRDQEFGAWTKYNNHAATGWANLGEDAFFGTTNGQVFSIRKLNESSDYRDDSSAIDMTIVYRALDFGAPGLRKIVAGVNSHFQLRRTSMNGTTMFSSEDLDGSFANAGTFTFTKGATTKAVSALSSLPRRRMQYLQLKYTNSTKDEDVVLAGIDFHVAGLPRFGLPQQNETV